MSIYPKKAIITNAKIATEHHADQRDLTKITSIIFEGPDTMQVSDGYHTMDELYDHRIALFITLCRTIVMIDDEAADPLMPVWRSKLHSDGSTYEGWFVLGIFKEQGKQITYHLPLSRWDECDFAEVIEKAPTYDGHSSQDVLERIKKL